MKKWAFVLGAAAAMGVAAVVVTLALRRSQPPADSVPEIIADCVDRMQRIEAELHRLHSAA